MTGQDRDLAFDLGIERVHDLDLAARGLLGPYTNADHRRGPSPERLAEAKDTLTRLQKQAPARPFTPREQGQWRAALDVSANHHRAKTDQRWADTLRQTEELLQPLWENDGTDNADGWTR
jgi:hypothetical protein